MSSTTPRAADGPVRDCTCPRTHHEHGTRNAYVVDKCRCRLCRDAASAYERHRQRQAAYGRWTPYVDAQPARDHVRALSALGVGWKSVAHAANLKPSVLWKLLYGDRSRNLAPSKRIRQATSDAILSVPLDPTQAGRDGTLLDATATWQHIHGLVALGYPQSWIARQIGQQGSGLQLSTDKVMVRTARLVQQLAEQIGDTPGPSVRARNDAARRGWRTPLQQWADSLDAPGGPDVDDIAVELAIAGETVTLTHDERIEVARRMLAAGRSRTDIARATRTNGQTVQRLEQAAREAGAA